MDISESLDTQNTVVNMNDLIPLMNVLWRRGEGGGVTFFNGSKRGSEKFLK